MSPRQKFDRHMLVVGMARHRKFVGLTDSEWRAHVGGILSLAAQSPRRGYLLIAEGVQVGPEEVANEAGGRVTAKIAESSMDKLKDRGVLEYDDEAEAWFVHDWWDVNPDPRHDSTGAKRQADWRARNGPVTDGVTARVTANNAGEVEVEVEEKPFEQVRKSKKRVDQAKPPEGLAIHPKLVAALPDVLVVLCRVWDVCGGIEPQQRGVGLAMLRNPLADHLAVAAKLEQWLTAGRGQRARCADIAARFGDWVADESAADRRGAVQPMTARQRVVAAQNDWQRFYPKGAA